MAKDSIDINRIKGDVIGGKIEGTGNFAGKTVNYVAQGDIIYILNLPTESKSALKESSIPTQISAIRDRETTIDTRTLQRINAMEERINEILNLLTKVSDKNKMQIKQVKAGELQISRNDLLIRAYIFSGNEHYFSGMNLIKESVRYHYNVRLMDEHRRHADEEFEKAIERYNWALEINPRHVNTLIFKGHALIGLRRNDEAIEYFDRALQINPKHVKTLIDKGDILKFLKRYQEAIECYNWALQINPNNAYPWCAIGDALSLLGQHHDAIKYYDMSLGINPNYVRAWENKGGSLSDLGKDEDARKCYKKAYELESRIQ